MKIRNTFKRGNKVFPQKDIILNHCYRLTLANDEITYQLHYLGDLTRSIRFEENIDELVKANVCSSFEKYIGHTLFDTLILETIFIKSYGEMQIGYKPLSNDVIILGESKDEILLLIFCDQCRRSKTIFGAFKATQMNNAITPANQLWRLINDY